MKKELRKATYKEKMLFNKYQHINSTENWEKYRKQRNYVTKFRKNKSINQYFIERCPEGSKIERFLANDKTLFTQQRRYHTERPTCTSLRIQNSEVNNV
jgi:hypothetical protein